MTITKEMIEERVLERLEQIKDIKLKEVPTIRHGTIPILRCRVCCEKKECPYYILSRIREGEHIIRNEIKICKDCAVRAKL